MPKLRTFARCALLVLASIAIGSAPALAQAPDQPGALQVETKVYNYGDQVVPLDRFPIRVELKGSVTFPRGLPGGPYPLILLLHGRHATCMTDAPKQGQRSDSLQWPCPQGARPIESFQGYGYLAEFLASHGYIVVSISANGINAADGYVLDLGAAARAQLIDRHLLRWHELSTKGGEPFGNDFLNKVDLTHIGTMGHSRGGEGVLFHYLFNRGLNRPFTIRAVLPLAPMNQRRSTIAGVPFGIILPYCDGDLSDLPGVHYYDAARYAQPGDPAPKYYFLMMGANHNFFNTMWSPSSRIPGSFDDWQIAGDPFCGSGQASRRFNEQKQRKLGLVYMSMFFRVHLGGEQRLASYLQGLTKPVADQRDDDVLVAYHAPDSRGVRYDLNRLQDAGYMRRNSLGGNVQIEQIETADMCGGGERQFATCLPREPITRQPHNTPSDVLLAPEAKGLNVLRLGWQGGGGRFINEVPQERADISGYQWLQFRAALNYADARNQNTARDFSIRIVDHEGKSASTRVSQHSRALSFPPGQSRDTPKVVLTTARIPLNAFQGVNLKRAKSVEFVFKTLRRPALSSLPTLRSCACERVVR